MVLSYKEGRFFLSVPLFVDEKTIEAFLQANASWIQEKRESKVKKEIRSSCSIDRIMSVLRIKAGSRTTLFL